MTGDFDGDGLTELVFWSQGANCLCIAEIPDDPKKSDEWPWKPIFSYTDDSEMEPKGGLNAYPAFRRVNEHEGLVKAARPSDAPLLQVPLHAFVMPFF